MNEMKQCPKCGPIGENDRVYLERVGITGESFRCLFCNEEFVQDNEDYEAIYRAMMNSMTAKDGNDGEQMP